MTTSVAMCTYNGARFIEEQLRSIIDQTIPVGEVVVCDDCSTDKTVAIIERVAKETSIPIHIHINETNLGCARNFEKAISLCNGDVIFLSDQDDIWMPNKVETIVNWFKANPTKEVVISDAILIDEYGNRLINETYFSLYFDEYSRSLFDCGYGIELFANRNRACGATMAIRNKIGKYLSEIVHNKTYDLIFRRCVEYKIIHDYLIAIKAIGDGSMGYINKILTHYRQHNSQVCGVGDLKKIMGDEAYLIDYDKGDRLCALPLTHNTKIRLDFIFWRSKLEKNVFAPIIVFLNLMNYKRMYGVRYNLFLKHDVQVSLKKTVSRINKKMVKIFNGRVKKVFISYGDTNFDRSLTRIRQEASALKIFDKIILYTPKDLPDEILQSPLMRYQRGGGYWLWKPYVIWKTMQRYPKAVVVYADAGCTLNKNYEEWRSWFKIMESTDTLFTQYRSNTDYGWDNRFHTSSVKISTWTKRMTIEYFDQQFKSTEWHDYNKIWGGFVIARNNSCFIREWLDIMLTRPELVRDPEGEEINNQYDSFVAHRHDQSIITPLAYLYERKYPNVVKIIPETGESSSTAAVVASRIKDVNIISLKTRVILQMKSILGERIYKFLHFWK